MMTWIDIFNAVAMRLNDTDRHCPHKSQLGARTFLPELRICFGFNLKMIEAFLDGPSNGKYNSQRLAGA